MRNNKGFSLVELIVVIAIMSVLTGMVTISMRSATGAYVKQCTSNMESQIKNTKHMTMAKSRVSLQIYVGADGAYYSDMIVYGADQTTVLDTTTTKLGRKSVTVEYTNDASMAESSFSTLTATNPINIEFDRSSGSMKDKTNCVRKIVIYQGSYKKSITFYAETGKISVVRETENSEE